MPFLYLRDPLFLVCFCGYWINRFVVRQLPHPEFFDAYFNDLICIPFFVPILVYTAKLCRLRHHDHPPLMHEIVIPLVMWSVLFEIIFPLHPYWREWVYSDPYDIFYYSLGACLAAVYWQYAYRSRSVETPERST